jgi:ATP-dependent DNA helicase MPH1
VWSTIIRCQPCFNEDQVYIKKCSNAGILYGNLDPVAFHSYRTTVAMEEVKKRPDCGQLRWVFPVLKNVGILARAMGYLVRETVPPCGSMLKR